MSISQYILIFALFLHFPHSRCAGSTLTQQQWSSSRRKKQQICSFLLSCVFCVHFFLLLPHHIIDLYSFFSCAAPNVEWNFWLDWIREMYRRKCIEFTHCADYAIYFFFAVRSVKMWTIKWKNVKMWTFHSSLSLSQFFFIYISVSLSLGMSFASIHRMTTQCQIFENFSTPVTGTSSLPKKKRRTHRNQIEWILTLTSIRLLTMMLNLIEL